MKSSKIPSRSQTAPSGRKGFIPEDVIRGNNTMQAVLLAGGLGTRLKPVTNTIPKPMVPILGQPYLHYQLQYLKGQELTRILILTGYLGEQIEEHFQDGSGLGLSIQYSREPEPLGTGGALRYAKNKLEDTFFLINGDSFLPVNFSDVKNCFHQSRKKGLAVIYPNTEAETGVVSNIAVDDSQLITEYNKEASEPPLNYVDAGITAFKKEILSLIPEDQKTVSLEQEIYPLLIQENELIAYTTKQRFYDIGRPERIQEFEDYIKEKK